MWTSENRPKYNRDKLRYPSDLTDDEWSHVEPLIPPAKRGGRKRSVEPRKIVNGLMYVLSTGCQWRYVPKDLPPKSTLFDYFENGFVSGIKFQPKLRNWSGFKRPACSGVVGSFSSPSQLQGNLGNVTSLIRTFSVRPGSS